MGESDVGWIVGVREDGDCEVGRDVGSRLGRLVGDCDVGCGLLVGDPVVGSCVGMSDGDCEVGSGVGMRDGDCDVGSCVGM